ncbi:hypothetical protein IV87_GL001797 [Pediococcus ethanolidurans]|nr:hypothetical protein IV87_GL001797 [Pediococcus ethanolidurans]
MQVYSDWQVEKMGKEYRNDERWNSIKLRAGNVTKTYYQYTVIMIAILMTFSLFWPTNILVRLDRVLLILLLIIDLGHVVEYLAVKRLDKVM